MYVCLFVILFLLWTTACQKEKQDTATPQDFNELEKKISRYSFPVDSLLILLSQSEKNKDDKTKAPNQLLVARCFIIIPLKYSFFVLL